MQNGAPHLCDFCELDGVRDGSHLSEENSLEVVRQQHTFLKVLLLRIFFYIDVTLKRFLFFFSYTLFILKKMVA